MDPSLCWEAMVDRLTAGDITKDELVYKLSYESILMRMQYWHQRDIIMEQQRRTQELKNKARR